VLGAPFIAMAQVTVYAGAIMVLFLFVIMLLGTDKLPPGRALPWQRPLAIGLAVIMLAEAAFALVQRLKITVVLQNPSPEVNSPASLVTLGKALFQMYLLPFEVTSVLLLVAMVGVIVLAKREKGEMGS
jgi:NADH-quinone oxidoreductase subunit J